MAASHKLPHPSWKKRTVAKDLGPAMCQCPGGGRWRPRHPAPIVSLPTQALLTSPGSSLDPPHAMTSGHPPPLDPQYCFSSLNISLLFCKMGVVVISMDLSRRVTFSLQEPTPQGRPQLLNKQRNQQIVTYCSKVCENPKLGVPFSGVVGVS